MELLTVMGAAFLGGLILNIMPCVLPVLTMKVFHVIEKAKEDPSINRRHGIAYTLGILTFFWAFAAIILVLRAGGEKMGWGMQFQNPAMMAFVIALMVLFGLNALGVFEITVGMSSGDGKKGYLGTYINGIVAAVMATPCSAPILGTALGVVLASGASYWQTVVAFTLIGFGLAFPFLLISYVPAIGRVLPKPGAWMESFKQLMGFTLLAAAIYFFGALQSQITKEAQQWFLYFMLAMSVGVWAIGKFAGLEHSDMRRRVVMGLSIGLTAVAGYFMLDFTPLEKTAPVAATSGDDPVVVDGKINWAPFSPDVVAASLERGRPVFMDYTADWCVNCKTNERVFIEVEKIREDLTRTNILPMKADFTNEDEIIEEWMTKLGREAIPIYVIYYPDGKWHLLPETITTGMLSDALAKASAKYPPGKFKPAAPPAKPAAPSEDAPKEEKQATL